MQIAVVLLDQLLVAGGVLGLQRREGFRPPLALAQIIPGARRRPADATNYLRRLLGLSVATGRLRLALPLTLTLSRLAALTRAAGR